MTIKNLFINRNVKIRNEYPVITPLIKILEKSKVPFTALNLFASRRSRLTSLIILRLSESHDEFLYIQFLCIIFEQKGQKGPKCCLGSLMSKSALKLVRLVRPGTDLERIGT